MLFEKYRKGEHEEVLKAKPFPTEFAHNKICKWIRKSMANMSRPVVPILISSKTVSGKTAEDLRKTSKRLHEQVDDPLEETRKIAATASLSLNEKKKSAHKTKFDDDDDEEMEEAEASVQLSAVPPKPADADSKSSQEQSLKSPTSGSPRKRKAWSIFEANAVKAGVVKFGSGNWTRIKAEYEEILEDRTTVMIKDKWRTMLSNGEVEEPATTELETDSPKKKRGRPRESDKATEI